MSPTRLAVLCDYAEEGWPSMDLVADMIVEELDRRDDLRVARVRPPFRHRATRLPFLGRAKSAFNADRVLNRFVDYPRRLRPLIAEFDLFHLIDHSYAQLVRALPPERTGVFCHDLDTFRCLIEPARDPRPRWYRAMTRATLKGLASAALVFHGAAEVGAELRRHGLVDPNKLVHAPLGVAPEFCLAAGVGERLVTGPYLLHVGSCIPRKRIDVLLEVAGALRAERPDLRLVKVGGPWAPEHAAQIETLGLRPALVEFTGISRTQLARLYAQAALVLQPSDAEGFGLPLIEGLACGASVLASDLPVHLEIGGDAIRTAPVGDVPAWISAAARLIDDPASAPEPKLRRTQAARYSWSRHAEQVWSAYQRLV